MSPQIPNWMFQNQDGTPCEIKTLYKAIVATTANQEVIPAVSGKRLRILGLTCFSDGAATALNLKNGSGGAIMMWGLVPVNTASTNLIYPMSEIGYADTDAGVGLFADGMAVATRLCVRYIEYS